MAEPEVSWAWKVADEEFYGIWMGWERMRKLGNSGREWRKGGVI